MSKFYHTLNQTPRNPHGKYRRTRPPAHGHSVDRTDNGARGTSESNSILPGAITYIAPPGWTFFPEPTAPTIPYAGLRTGELIGHRLWWVLPGAGELWLSSFAHKRLWFPDETVSGNLDEVVLNLFPKWVYGGVYAFSSFENLVPMAEEEKKHVWEWYKKPKEEIISFWGWDGTLETDTFVYGTVKMWGDVVEHEKGYRAEYAKLNSLDAIYGSYDLDVLKQKYLGA